MAHDTQPLQQQYKRRVEGEEGERTCTCWVWRIQKTIIVKPWESESKDTSLGLFVHGELAVYSACIKEKDLIWGKDRGD